MKSLIAAVLLIVIVASVLAIDLPSLPSLPSRRFFIGGSFDYLLQRDGSQFNANNFAYYEDDVFGTYGNGTNGPVLAISVDLCRNIYIGGDFDTVDGIKTGPIAKYSFKSGKWQALGTPVFTTNQQSSVYSISTDCVNIPDIQKQDCNCDVYIAGNFRMTIGSEYAQNVAKFKADGSSWDALQSGNEFISSARTIYKRSETSVTDADDLLWVGGDFGFKKYQLKDKKWTTIEMSGGRVTSMHYTVVPLFWKTDSIVVAGQFSFTCEGGTCTNIATYDRGSGKFAPLGTTQVPSGIINSFDMTKGDVYAGGTFVDGPFSYIAYLKDGSSGYTAISGSAPVVAGPVKYLKACGYNDVGCARGSFAVAGTNALTGNYLAFYNADGAQWLPFGNTTAVPGNGYVNVVEFAVTNSARAIRYSVFAIVFAMIVSLITMNM
jgi:hypothetical protein